MSAVDFRRKRDRLIALLGEAAELEHSVCCQYLFAAVSMRTHPDEGLCTWPQVQQIQRWKGTLLSIARMEMEHLAIVSNLLTAFGEGPWFRHAEFPTGKTQYAIDMETKLQRFEARSLARFVLFELPDHETECEDELRHALARSKLPEDVWLHDQLANARELEKHALVVLYDEIYRLVDELACTDSAALFVGPPAAQVGQAAVFPTFPPVPAGGRVYDVLVPTVTDRTSALAAVDQIRIEGEGSASSPLGESHFDRFATMYLELSKARTEDGEFRPGRDVVENPVPRERWLRTEPEPTGVTFVTHPSTVEAMEIFDLAYDVTLRMLTRLFADIGPRGELAAIEQTVFFPMMTLVLRPLAEMLTQMPAFDGQPDGERAGPSFRCPRDVTLLPHAEAAWAVLHGQLVEASDRARALAARGGVGAPLRTRIDFLADNLWRMAYNFAGQTGLQVKP